MVQRSGKRAPKVRFGVVGNNTALVDRVIGAIQNQIVSERLPVGTKLPAERELAESLGVSRTVVREAVRVLGARGLLETTHGIGTTVRAMTREEVVEPLRLFFRSVGEEVNLKHLHQVRSLLEVENARVAAEQASEQDINDLGQILTEMNSNKQDVNAFTNLDSAFHRRLAQTTHNPLLILLLDSIQDLMAEVRKFVSREEGLFERVMPGHRAILESIRSQDPVAAMEAMRAHLSAAFDIQQRAVVAQSAQGKKRSEPGGSHGALSPKAPSRPFQVADLTR